MFREGDKLLAIQDDIISNYRYVKNENGSHDFIDEEYPEEFLDFFDLANCKFIIMLGDDSKNYIKVITTPVGFDTDLFIKNHNELIKRWFENEYR